MVWHNPKCVTFQMSHHQESDRYFTKRRGNGPSKSISRVQIVLKLLHHESPAWFHEPGLLWNHFRLFFPKCVTFQMSCHQEPDRYFAKKRELVVAFQMVRRHQNSNRNFTKKREIAVGFQLVWHLKCHTLKNLAAISKKTWKCGRFPHGLT